MSNPRDFLDVEQLVIDKLKADVTTAKDVVRYAGQLDDVIEGRLVKGFPLVAVLFTGDAPEQIDGMNYRVPTEFTVLVVAHTMKGSADTTASAGEVVRAVRDSLTNQRLADNLERLLLGPTALVYSSTTATAYQIGFTVAMDQEFDPE